MPSFLSLLAIGATLQTALAAPAPASALIEKRIVVEDSVRARAPEPTAYQAAPIEKRSAGVLASELSMFNSLLSVGIANGLENVAYPAIVAELAALIPTATPTATKDVPTLLGSIYAEAKPTGFLEAAVGLVSNGLYVEKDLAAFISGDGIGEDSPSNTANPAPSQTIYPKKLSCDAPYSQTEAMLREQIYIPDTFTYGKKQPVILFPGTGSRADINFAGNFEVTLKNVSYADLILVNPTSFLLADAQLSAELAAYAINYVSAISGGVNVSIIAWSQGNINIQWANKYWPSTRSILSDHIAISPDYHGTILANLVDPVNIEPMPAGFIQQEYNSNFITTLRSNGGDSAYVPTTNIYSAKFDEIVEPQQNPNASAILNDVRNVGVTNAEIQAVCGADSPAGFFQTHESMLASSLAYALAVDALTHSGPGLVSRINTAEVCQMPFAPGLGLEDILATENILVIAGAALLLYPTRMTTEPAISAYAKSSPTSCKASATSTSSKKI